ncbi:malate:quinone oxidoreductase family protein [Cryptosporidium andersoni]|uniref:L-2-hydroxyglutarate dehydrogenase, mitochondrial n=1 Tax=Cryptosporidium andersoni TaxID=117008 RepID=A0A1J4MSH5_9CRYT|nr:malate:quinone oxidoreductase family protein [Cryptosporidium andersoni]
MLRKFVNKEFLHISGSFCIGSILNNTRRLTSVKNTVKELSRDTDNKQNCDINKSATDINLGYSELRTGTLNTSPLKVASDACHDVIIIGGGVTGTALFYTLSRFTNLKRICLIERHGDVSQVASNGRSNSQTIHCGDIETNYNLEKARKVLRQANMLRNYATKLSPSMRDQVIFKLGKMVLGVGELECEIIEKRFNEFKFLYPHMNLLGKREIGDIEPCVAYKNTITYRPDPIASIYVPDEHTGVDYYQLAVSFLKGATEACENSKGKYIMTCMNTKVLDIIRMSSNGDLYKVITNRGEFYGRYIVVSACGYSLLFAKKLGYNSNLSCLPVAGSFYFSSRPLLNGKVYTIQNPELPFAAVHGDPDIIMRDTTRFGPTALPLPLLERNNLKSIADFFKIVNPDLNLALVYKDLFCNSSLRNYALRNILFEVPIINKNLFIKDCRKIIPSLDSNNIKYAHGFGGIRPQIIDKSKRKLLLGEGKITTDEGLIFNITPSPGGTTCLGTAENDMRIICSRLGAQVDELEFKKTLLQGDYSVD